MKDAPPNTPSYTVVLPEEVPAKPNQTDGLKFKEPVRWLLGEQIIADLKLLVLHALFGTKLDARDWMTPDIIKFLVPEQPPPGQPPSAAAEPEKIIPVNPSPDQVEEKKLQALRNSVRYIELPPVADQCSVEPEKEFWFDYLSDTGDGQRATYSVAYACMSHLSLATDELGAEVELAKSSDCEAVTHGGATFLPRGRFLFIGGDTSYNVAEYATLVERFQTPFCWAYQDLINDGYYSEDERKYRRPMFGIPGNHDYYDALDGFNRQFRQPITEKLGTISDYRKLLHIPAFQRLQEASYVALQLPFGWWFWGLDTENNELDFRQKEFFKSLPNPQKLIVATPSPTTHFGRQARLDDKLTGIFKSVELELPFLSEQEKEKLPAELRQIPGNKCRLDLSGDIHHYARYWGPGAPKSSEWATGHVTSNQGAPGGDNYASVMAGGGGAFFHPSDTDIGEVEEQVLYPRHAESRSAVFRKLFNPWAVRAAGKVWLLGIIMSCFIFFAVTVPRSGSDALNTFPLWEKLNITQRTFIQPTVRSEQEQLNLQKNIPAPPLHDRFSGFIGPWNPQKYVAVNAGSEVVNPCEKRPLFFWGPCQAPPPLDYYLGVALALLSLVIIVWRGAWRAYNILGDDHPRRVNKLIEETGGTEKAAERTIAQRTAWEIVLVALAALASLGLGIYSIYPFLAFSTPFANSLFMFLTLLVTGSAVFIALNYEDWRFKLISQKKVPTSSIPKYLMWLLAVASFGFGLWFFGRNNLAAYLVSDILLCIFILGITVGLTLLAFAKGKELHRGIFLLVFVFIGLWHATLQLLVPLFLILKGNVLALIYAAIVVTVFTLIGLSQADIRRREKKLNNRYVLIVLWVFFGSLMLFWPLAPWFLSKWWPEFTWNLPAWLTYPIKIPLFSYLLSPILELFWTGGQFYKDALDRLLAAGVIGAVMSCVWFGWYLAIMLAFNSHNNEAGGAARLEGFKQFIRIRLTPDRLTAYVIGFNDAKQNGKDLDLRLIDSFTIRASPPQ